MEGQRRLLEWKATAEERSSTASAKRTADGEWLHATTHSFKLAPGGAADRVKVDDWVNGRGKRPFVAVGGPKSPYPKLRFKMTTSMLDPVVAELLTLPGGWDWHPGAEHPAVALNTLSADETDKVDAAKLVIAIRSEIAVRESVCRTLNCTSVTLIEQKTSKTVDLALDWAAALKAGRTEVDRLLGTPEDMEKLGTGPSDLDEVFLATMCAGDKAGLGKLLGWGIITPGTRSGSPFQARSKTHQLTPDRSGEIHAAYNHLRFVLYLEYRALHELMVG